MGRYSSSSTQYVGKIQVKKGLTTKEERRRDENADQSFTYRFSFASCSLSKLRRMLVSLPNLST